MNLIEKLFNGRLLLALFSAALCASLYWFGWIKPLDRLIYDLFNEAVPLEAADDIVIVAIDEKSLGELGRWPWPREHHVALLRALADAQPRAVAIDILFTEPYRDAPQVDALLGESLAAVGKVVLPIFIGQYGSAGGLAEVPPIADLRNNVAAIGHVHIEIDDDGVARSVYLKEGLGSPRWRHFAVELAALLGQAPAVLPGVSDAQVLASPNPRYVIRSHSNLVPYMGPAGTVSRLSYVDVLNGRVDAEKLRGKILLVGATAAGHVDNVSTSMGQIPGVELNANIFQALRTGKLAQSLPASWSALLGFCLIFSTVFGFTRLGPGGLLLAVLSTSLLLLASVYLLFVFGRIWLSPAPILVTLLIAYPLWNWLRLAMAMEFIREHLDELTSENRTLAFGLDRVPSGHRPVTDPVDRILRQLDAASKESRRNREVFQQTLDQLLSGVILADLSGRLLLVNQRASALLGMTEEDAELGGLLSRLKLAEGEALDHQLAMQAESGELIEQEIHIEQTGRTLLMQCDVIDTINPLRLVVLTDITDLKALENRRADALQFLSHDLRAPLSSVLSLVQEARDEPGSVSMEDLLPKVERSIRSNLSYAENYIQLSRLEQHSPPTTESCDSRSLIDGVVAQLYHTASRSRIDIVVNYRSDDVWLDCNRDLVERALLNLLDNAIKHSPRGAEIDIILDRRDNMAVFAVFDQGPGLDEQDLARLFEPWQQGIYPRGGLGLGLRFVHAVAELHSGEVSASNRARGGASFILSLPCTS